MIQQIQIPENTSAPSLGSSAMLVDFGASVWTGRKLDKSASAEVEYANKVQATGIANVHKRLMGKCAELVAIQKFVANARNGHYSMSLPWSDLGLRLVPTTMFFKYNKAMTEFEQEFHNLVTKFLDVYEVAKTEARDTLGDLFREGDYPSIENLQSKFAWKLSFIPLPDSGDFRVDIGNEQANILKEQYTQYYNTQYQNAMSDMWTRLSEPLKRMSERLDYADSEDKKVFRDTLVTNVMDVLELLNACNIDNDPSMEMTYKKLRHAFNGVTPDALREDEYLRAETKRTVDEVIKNLPSIGI